MKSIGINLKVIILRPKTNPRFLKFIPVSVVHGGFGSLLYCSIILIFGLEVYVVINVLESLYL